MQAIQTKYLGATNAKPSRIKAWCDAASVTVSWDYDLDTEGNHANAAKALALKLGWVGTWHCGGIKHGMVFVSTHRNPYGMFKVTK